MTTPRAPRSATPGRAPQQRPQGAPQGQRPQQSSRPVNSGGLGSRRLGGALAEALARAQAQKGR